MDREQKIEYIRQKCEEVAEPKRAIAFDLGEPPRLADVLLAIGNIGARWAIEEDNFILTDFDGKVIFDYNLRKDDLTKQSDECINFLYTLLTPPPHENV